MAQAHANELLLSGKYSDLTLKCRAREFRVHKAIMCPQSEVFSKAVDGPFKEVESNCIELIDDKPDDVRRMTSFLYTGDYETEDLISCGDEGEKKQKILQVLKIQLINIAVYSIADKYDLSALKKCAVDKFNKIPARDWFEHATELVRSVFDTTPDADKALRGHIMFHCARGSDAFANNVEFQHLVEKDIPEAGVLFHKFQCQIKSEIARKKNQDLVKQHQEVLQLKEKTIKLLNTEITNLKNHEAKMYTSMKNWRIVCNKCSRSDRCVLETVNYHPSGFLCRHCI